jgi:hypothetical protein
MTLFNLFKTTIKPYNRYYNTNNGSINENDNHFPYRFKTDFCFTYEQYMAQHISFYLDMYSRKLPDHCYLLVITVNDVEIMTDNLGNIEKSCKIIANIILNRYSKSSIIRFKLMHCFLWEEKCPTDILNFLRSTEAKGSLVRSKLKNYFHKFKPVPGPFGI